MFKYFFLKELCGLSGSPSASKKIAELGLNDITLTTRDNIKLKAIFEVPEIIDHHTGYILMIHGRANNRLDFYKLLGKHLISLNNAVLILDPRGFSDSHGTVSEDGFNLDIQAGMEFLEAYATPWYSTVSIVATSLGTGMAVNYLAWKSMSNIPVVLLAPFTSTLDIAVFRAWMFKYVILAMDFTLRHPLPFDNLRTVRKLNGKDWLVIHGDHDRDIPCSQGRKLAEIVGAKFVAVKGLDHLTVLTDANVQKLLVDFIHKFDNKLR